MDAIQILILFIGVVAVVSICLAGYYVHVLTDEYRPYKRGAELNFMEKFIKKQDLIGKYYPDRRKQAKLINSFRDEKDRNYWRHWFKCEKRFLERIKKL